MFQNSFLHGDILRTKSSTQFSYKEYIFLIRTGANYDEPYKH